jgi:hypothetical protein
MLVSAPTHFTKPFPITEIGGTSNAAKASTVQSSLLFYITAKYSNFFIKPLLMPVAFMHSSIIASIANPGRPCVLKFEFNILFIYLF